MNIKRKEDQALEDCLTSLYLANDYLSTTQDAGVSMSSLVRFSRGYPMSNTRSVYLAWLAVCARVEANVIFSTPFVI